MVLFAPGRILAYCEKERSRKYQYIPITGNILRRAGEMPRGVQRRWQRRLLVPFWLVEPKCRGRPCTCALLQSNVYLL